MKKTNHCHLLPTRRLKKLLLIMKLTTILVLALTIQVSANVYAQTKKFDLSLKDISVKEVLKTIESQSDFRFFYNDELSDVNRLVSVEMKDMPVEMVLSSLFDKTKVSYKVLDNNLIVISPTELMTQQMKVTGKVIDATTNEPLPGVNIQVEGTTQGTITDAEGKYELQVAGSETFIVFSYVGYISQRMQVGQNTTINISLAADIKSLDEVVVIGYGVQKKSVVTGAIGSIKSEDLANSSISRAEQALQGKTAGVQVIQNSGAPGAGINVRIRGYGSNKSTEPIYIVNGTKVNSLSAIDPNDIQNIEVLKDAASAAIYGAEGGNGVVLVTTKSGQSGKGRLTYEFQYSLQSLAKEVEVLNAADYKTYMTEAGTLPSSALDDPYDTDWQDEIFKTTPTQKHYLSFTGGSDRGSFMLSMSYLNQDGIVDGDKDKYQRYTLMFNSDYKLNDWIKAGHNVTFTRTDLKSLSENSEYTSVITSALMLDPLTPAYYKDDSEIPAMMASNIATGDYNYLKNGDGKYYGVSEYVSSTANPFVVRDATYPESQNNMLFGNIFVDLTPFKGFTFTSRMGVNVSSFRSHNYSPEYYYDPQTNNASSSVSEATMLTTYWQWENFATYARSFGNHNATLLLGMSSSDNKINNLSGDGSPLTNDNLLYDDLENLVANPSDNVSSSRGQTRKLSYFGRANYDFKSKYMFQFSLRKDAAGADYLPDETRWGTFPAVSAGWVLSNEGFFPKSFITFAKIRASWGQNGNLSNLGSYIYMASLAASGAYPIMETPTSATLATATEPANLSNYDLTWETSEQTDIGIDLRAFNDRVTFSMDYYVKKTKDLLTTGTPPLEAGNTATIVNAGDVENKGFEFEASYRNKIGELNYNISANLATLHNEVTYMNPNSPYLTGATVNLETATRFDEGHPIWYFYGYKTYGIDPNNGKTIYYNAAGDTTHTVSSADKQYIGSGIPTLTYGFNIDLSYKGFDFKAFAQGASGHDVMVGMVRTDRINFNKLQVYFDDRWTAENTDGTMPAATAESNTWHSDFMIFKGNYMKIKQIQIGYTLPKDLMSKIKVTNARIYISLENAFTFTKYPGMDPEVGSSPSSAGINYINSIGIDRGMYPNARTLLFGASISL
jgi:TonB-dependent starch-binding outer membrane protein SusC